ncbi:GlsB/YeaQ/YmgE family stress response membrane protein [Brevibacterium sp. UCMA 11752]|uniref:GlsB/YeaQ/YmgE family stress response membrane protein n=1 Tax=Brevibacterium sp. UCMA 11752 TaxID=2745946 RepID=UPI001F2E0ACB|nr:GlsB/YeaQ/YmgE family stress response membrane protein [Brevibacterium sp. UCMA 11752]MCF2585730.1 GlsB/YeaQ/YmgE family stress response membrane protein [Brevibacterium sp. UCMA 11752]
MGFIAYLVLGLIAGAIAKLILPGRQGGGWIATLVLGVIGALLGGWIGSAVFGAGVSSFFDISTWLCAIGGSLIVLIVWGLITGRSRAAKA